MSSNFSDCPKCVLFVPCDRPDMLAKAARYDAHGYMLDLEGAVTASEKERARQCVRAAIEGLAKSGYMVMPCANRLDFGPWEQIYYGEFDGRCRKRVFVKIIGE